MDEFWVAALWALLPTVVVASTFYVVIRAVMHADRNERRAYARLEAQERARLGLPPSAQASDQ